tara:strand:- start:3895 stop:4782 length:888 start_codon:yes stop_codon:yes gene_type:complete
MTLQERLTASVVKLFSEGDQPLAHTHLYPNDPGLFGPDSVSWKIMGDVSSFAGGVRALLLQALHPEVAAGVADHSAYKSDPLGRLNRTSLFVTTANYGSMPEVQSAVQMVTKAHGPVNGVSERGFSYSANQPQLAAWVQNTLTDSFLEAYQTFCRPLEREEADQFVEEQAKIGALLGVVELPQTAEDLRSWIVHHPDLAESKALHQAWNFLRNPPLNTGQLVGYKVIRAAAVATLPNTFNQLTHATSSRGAIFAGRRIIGSLRWAMKYSPAWKAALDRCGATYDHTKFRSFEDRP